MQLSWRDGIAMFQHYRQSTFILVDALVVDGLNVEVVV